MYAFILEQGSDIRSQVVTQEATNTGLKHGQSRSETYFKISDLVGMISSGAQPLCSLRNCWFFKLNYTANFVFLYATTISVSDTNT